MKIVVHGDASEAQHHEECQLDPCSQRKDGNAAGAPPVDCDDDHQDDAEAVDGGRHDVHDDQREHDEVQG